MTLTIPVFRSFDQAKVEEFYLGFLGFAQDWTHRFDANAPLYQQLSLQHPTHPELRCVLHLSEHHGDACPGAAVRIAWADLATFQQQLLDQQYRYARPGLETTPWGMREVRLADPFGNRLVFAEDLPEGA
ncbi:glyoxalase/bleomycin resistance/extradiol dioxygenase family protein [Comamonas serinivorans]|uniref:Bleomycin resistance protein n=1 Tax=Comamonas serinivorans TaxID=1082851 RepID=A0A1Y0EQR8_9BURK|nr:glyoxalase superfamily protein [Comamonas serinivorans]ARU05848.1 glyoxalase/bleomycin resistance/extradiol dioxygenase family protein [Comamonas serinivorans]